MNLGNVVAQPTERYKYSQNLKEEYYLAIEIVELVRERLEKLKSHNMTINLCKTRQIAEMILDV